MKARAALKPPKILKQPLMSALDLEALHRDQDEIIPVGISTVTVEQVDPKLTMPKAETQRLALVAAVGQQVSKNKAQLKMGGAQNPNQFKH